MNVTLNDIRSLISGSSYIRFWLDTSYTKFVSVYLSNFDYFDTNLPVKYIDSERSSTIVNILVNQVQFDTVMDIIEENDLTIVESQD